MQFAKFNTFPLLAPTPLMRDALFDVYQPATLLWKHLTYLR